MVNLLARAVFSAEALGSHPGLFRLLAEFSSLCVYDSGPHLVPNISLEMAYSSLPGGPLTGALKT